MQITPYPKNAKKHPASQIKSLARAIKQFGFSPAIEVDKNGVIISGHGRWLASQELKWTELVNAPRSDKGIEKVPYIIITDLTPEEIRLKRLADNKLAETDIDMILAVEELKDLDKLGADITLAGYETDLLIEPDEQDDVIPENVPARSKLGDLYELGQHRVLCGDSTQEEAVLTLMDGKKADVSFTSPPYNVGHNIGYEGKESKYIHTDDKIDYQDLIVKTTYNSLGNAKDVFVNLQFLANNKKKLLLWLAELADNFKDIFFWKKLQVAPAMAENVANSQVEVIVLFGKDNNSRSWGNKKFRGNFSNSIETKSASGENKNAKIHNATFPVELPLTFLKQGYNEGSLVLDLFAGTGTTMIACEKLGMKSYLIDIEPTYVDVIVQRYVDYVDNPVVKCNGKIISWNKTK